MATIQISRVLLPLALIVLSACKPTVKDSETLGEARHREFFGLGPEISTWLFPTVSPPVSNVGITNLLKGLNSRSMVILRTKFSSLRCHELSQSQCFP